MSGVAAERPPRLAALWMRWAVPAALRQELLSEAAAAYRADVARLGRRGARRRYWREALSPTLLRLRWSLARQRRSAAPKGSSPSSRLGGPGPGRGSPPGRLLDHLRQDVHYALRGFASRPAFTAIAAITLAVGIGATTTVFTFVDNVLLRPLPYPEAERLVFFDDGSHPPPRFAAWSERTTSFEVLAASFRGRLDLTAEGEAPSRVAAAWMTPAFAQVFGARAVVGRLFAAGDFEEAGVALLRYGAWLQRWGGDPGIVGETLVLDGEPVVVVGVLGSDFSPPEPLVAEAVDLWLPFDPLAAEQRQRHGSYFLEVVGRLAGGTTLEAARGELDRLALELADEDPENYRRDDDSIVRFPLISLREATVGDIRAALWMLLGAGALMLVLSCANVANLLLARGTERGREIALRSAIGAGRGRVVSQLLTESVMLAFLAGVLGLALARLGVSALTAFATELPRVAEIAMDVRVLVAALALSAVTGIAFGVLPALQATRVDLVRGLRESSRGATAGRARLRASLVAAEVALAVILTIGAGLLLRSFVHLYQVDPGFSAAGVSVIEVDLQEIETSERGAFARQLVRRLREVPGVDAAGVAVTVPFQRRGSGRCCWFDRVYPERDGGFDEESLRVVVNPVDDGYFETIGATFRHGRPIGPQDDAESPGAVITREGARRLFGREDVVGLRIDIDHTFVMPIVGVVDELLHWGPGQPTSSDLYVPFAAYSEWFPTVQLVVRSARTDTGLLPELQQAVWSLAPDMPVDRLVTLDELVADSLERPRFVSLLLAGLAVLGLGVAAAGVHGSLLYAVGQRTREIGIRRALGAQRGEVVRLVVRQGILQVVAGLLVGVAGALLAGRALEGLLYEVTTYDGATFGAVAALMTVVALMSSWLPARRAARTDPAETLRAD